MKTTAGKKLLVRIRQKPIHEIPAWALCCDAVRAVYERQQSEPLEAMADPKPFVGSSRCVHCGRVVEPVKFVKVMKPLRGPWLDVKGRITAAAIECFEFDEGIERNRLPRRS